MSVLEIKVYPDKILRKVSEPVKDIDEEVKKLIDDMLETMYSAPGVGLSAVQVGVLKRIISLDPSLGEDLTQVMILLNPEIYEQEGSCIFEEGCLSVPEYFSDIERAERIKVRALDRDGEKVDFEADGLLARVILHEVDHLNGKLFVDHMPKVRKDVFRRKWLKERQEAKRA